MVQAAARASRPATVVAGRLRQRRLGLATTPGRLGLLLVGLVLLSLAWGALAATTAARYQAAARSVTSTREPLSLAAQQVYSRLSDANDAATTAFLSGGVEPAATRERYLADIAAASAVVENAAAKVGPDVGPAARDLAVLARGLPTYTQEIGNAEADYRLALPLGAAYLREATSFMRGTLLPAANDLYTAQNASLSEASAQATGLPLVYATAAAGLVVGLALYWSSRWLRGRTNRLFNVGLIAAGLALAVSLGWLAAAYLGARGDLLDARAQGSATVQAAADAAIVAQEAHADESLTLVDDTGDDSFQVDYVRQQRALGPGPGTLLGAAATAAAGTPAEPAVGAAISAARAWFAAHAQVRSLDDNEHHVQAVASVLGTGSGAVGSSFARLSGDLSAAMAVDQAVFDSTARSAVSAYTALVPGIAVAALLMAGACAWGLNCRLAEYR